MELPLLERGKGGNRKKKGRPMDVELLLRFTAAYDFVDVIL